LQKRSLGSPPKRTSRPAQLLGLFALLVPQSLAAQERQSAQESRPAQRADSVGNTTVVLVQQPAPSLFLKEAVSRLEGELRSSGFRVVRVTKSTEESRVALERAVATTGAQAGIYLERVDDRARAEVWVTDTLTGKVSIRPLDAGDSPAVLAVRAVELLRASLLELEPANTPSNVAREPIERLIAPHDEARSLRSNVGVEGSFVVALHPEVGAVALAPALRAFVSSSSGLGARISLVLPMLGASIEVELGLAKLSSELFLAEFVYTAPISPWFNLTAAVGLGGLHLRASGELEDPTRERSESLGSFVIAPSVGIVARVAEHFALTAEFSPTFLLPTLTIDMGPERLGTLGLPMLQASHGVLVTF
jgi:hypothetical protein